MPITVEDLIKKLTDAISSNAGGTTPNFPNYHDGDNFGDFLIQYEGLCTVHNYDDGKKKAAFLALLSPKTFQLLKNLIYPKSFDDSSYSTLTKTLKEHLRPTPLVIPSRHALHNRRQREGESIADYMAELRALARPCKYTETVLNEVLKDVFVAGIRSRSILDRLFIEEETADIKKLFSLAVTVEKAEESTSRVLGTASTSQDVHKLRKRTSKIPQERKPVSKPSSDSPNKSKSCSSCGKSNHLNSECTIRDKITCNYCSNKGHLSTVCRKKIAAEKKGVHNLASREPPWYSTVKVENVPIKFELDTGCFATIIPESIFKKLDNIDLTPTKEMFQPYGNSDAIRPIGQALVTVESKNSISSLPLYVVPGNNEPLMGRLWLQALNILKPVNRIQPEPRKDADYIAELQADFPDVFQPGIGLAPGTVSLKLLPNAQPVFRKCRPVPIALKDRIGQEIDKLVEAGILEPVDTSDWATPIVPVCKGDSVRITADYSCTLNPFLEVPHYPPIKAEDLFIIIGAKLYYVKIDIRKAYLCLAVDALSALLQVIITHKGLFKVNRLMFGGASAPVLWLKFIEKVLAGLEGVGIYFDDVCYGADDIETLYQLTREIFKRLSENGLRI